TTRMGFDVSRPSPSSLCAKSRGSAFTSIKYPRSSGSRPISTPAFRSSAGSKASTTLHLQLREAYDGRYPRPYSRGRGDSTEIAVSVSATPHFTRQAGGVTARQCNGNGFEDLPRNPQHGGGRLFGARRDGLRAVARGVVQRFAGRG